MYRGSYGHCQVLRRHCTLTLSHQCAVTMRRLVVRWPCTHPFASSSIIQLNQELQNPTVCPNGCVQTFRIIGHWIVYRGSHGPMATANQVLCRHSHAPCATSAQRPYAGLSCAGNVHIHLHIVVSLNETKNYTTPGFFLTESFKLCVLCNIVTAFSVSQLVYIGMFFQVSQMTSCFLFCAAVCASRLL